MKKGNPASPRCPIRLPGPAPYFFRLSRISRSSTMSSGVAAGGGRRRFLLQPVDLLDEDEDDEGQDDEIEQDGQEAAVGEYRHPGFLHFHQRHRHAFRHALQRQEQVGKVEAAENRADDRHDEVIDDRVDYLAEGRADDDANRQVHGIALDRKFLEFRHKTHVFPLFFDETRSHGW